jgi:hypothetical protein
VLNSTPRFYAVSDESQITAARYRSIAALSLPVNESEVCNTTAKRVLDAHDVKEFKWNGLRTAKRRFCAKALVDWVFDILLQRGGRIDVLVWDTQDSRHDIANRDDVKNFERMYFHLHKALMGRRSPASQWHLRPDEKLGVNWNTLRECLACAGPWRRYQEEPLLAEAFSLKHFNVQTLEQVQSCDLPLCQVADLFAGMAAFTRTRPDRVLAWIRKETGQFSLFDGEPEVKYTNSETARLPVVVRLSDRARALGLGVSLNTTGYLQTLDPRNPLNFWHYVPQHSADRAPTRSG